MKQNRGCAIFLLILVVIFSVIIAFALTSGGNDKTSEPEETSTESVDFNEMLQSQKNSLDSLIEEYESGAESPQTSAERLSGLADGIQNTIDMMAGQDGTDDLISYATALKGIASHYSEYIKTGNQSELDDVNALRETIE